MYALGSVNLTLIITPILVTMETLIREHLQYTLMERVAMSAFTKWHA